MWSVLVNALSWIFWSLNVSSTKLCIVLLLDGVFYKCELDEFDDCTIQVRHILIDFMAGWSFDYIYQVSNDNSELVFHPLNFVSFCLISQPVFGVYTLIITISYVEFIPLLLCNVLFAHDNFPCSEIILSEVNIATSTFFGLMLGQYIYFYPFSFKLSVFIFKVRCL